jgi:hypothetical protein
MFTSAAEVDAFVINFRSVLPVGPAPIEVFRTIHIKAKVKV